MGKVFSLYLLGSVMAFVVTAEAAVNQVTKAPTASSRPSEAPEVADVGAVKEAKEGAKEESNPTQEPTPFAEEKDVEAALDYLKKKSPKTNADALRIWKNYDGTTKPNFTYEFWARKLIIWLRDSRKLGFESPEKVTRVFEILLNKDLISRDASDLLSEKVWAFLQEKGKDHLTGMEVKMLKNQLERDPTEKDAKKKEVGD